MGSILHRLYRIARSAVPRPWEKPQPLGRKESPPTDETDAGAFGFDEATRSASGAGGAAHGGMAGVPARVVDDLAVFDLVPPATMDDVRRARNREIKKYHSDRFQNDPERLETSKQIMQIYNAAYDRLKTYYQEQAS